MTSKNVLPIRKIGDLNGEKGVATILYAIREAQSLSYKSLLHLLMTGTTDENIDYQNYRITSDFEMKIIRVLESLEQAQLILVSGKRDGRRFVDETQLQISPLFYDVQKALGFSLSALATASAESIYVQPTLGKPLDKSEVWSKIFMIMPFRDELTPVYKDHILKIANHLNVTCTRGDDFFSTEGIITEVWSAIYHAELCIADCTGRNPNVFYEIGVAHTVGRPCILIAQSIDDIPFDIRHLRVIIYKYTPLGMKDFETKLENTIRTVLGIQ
jgi:hypothetical protein